jgi:hypothetical protein
MPGGETISYHEMVGRIFDALGKPRRRLSGGRHLPWQSRSFRMKMLPWAPGWQRTWCSPRRRRSAISAGIRGHFIRDFEDQD